MTNVSESSTSKASSASPSSSDPSSKLLYKALTNDNKRYSNPLQSRSVPAERKQNTSPLDNVNFRKMAAQMDKSKKLVDQIYYHGELPRNETENLLKQQGEFLVRDTTKDGRKETILSVFWHTPHHFVINYREEPGQSRSKRPVRKYFLGRTSKSFTSIPELIHIHYTQRKQLGEKLRVQLLVPKQREHWEIRMRDILFQQQIGKGNFGKVFAGTLRKRNPDNEKSTQLKVAIKKCSGEITKSKRIEFLKEAQILRQYDHPNIVKFIGICPDLGLMIVMEYVDGFEPITNSFIGCILGGSLLKYLQEKTKNIELCQRISFCVDIASGMKYLESKNSIHMDLATRNCLIAKLSRKQISVKIADFGMSQKGVEEFTIGPTQKVSIRWSAPESIINGTFSTKTDVWSYGVVIWEIFSNAAVPYEQLTLDETKERISKYETLPISTSWPSDVTKLMKMCWISQPKHRPSFEHLHHETTKLLESNVCSPRSNRGSSLLMKLVPDKSSMSNILEYRRTTK